jgi:hypothetical protein
MDSCDITQQLYNDQLMKVDEVAELSSSWVTPRDYFIDTV